MPYCKLDSEITKSSIWCEPLHVRIVWISFLSEKDEFGIVSGSRSGLMRICNVTGEQFDEAIKVLESPDPESKTPDYEGRRIQKIEGGWLVLNSEKYRLPEETKKEKTRVRVARYRALHSVTEALHSVTAVSVCDSVSAFASVSDVNSEEVKEKPKKTKFVPPTLEEVEEYCNERQNNVDPERWYAYYLSKGWTVGKSPMKAWKPAIITWEKNQ